MADRNLIHDDIKLYVTAENFYLEPTINPTEILVINRLSGEASVNEYDTVKIPIPKNTYKPICGLLGSIKLISGYYLVVAKYRVLVGKLNGHDIYRLAGHEIIPYARSNTHLTSKQIESNQLYERMTEDALNEPGIYFSYGYDLTHTLQRTHPMPQELAQKPLVARADPRFLWNGHLLKNFYGDKFGSFTLPIIQGFVSINRMIINGHQITWSLVSRRSVERSGTRLFMRGIDAQGHVANFVETEQIVERGAEIASYVQTRGSIPLFWSQYPDIKYKPSMVLSHEDHVTAYWKHLKDQIQYYGNQVLVSLIDHTGKEQRLAEGFAAAVASAPLQVVRFEPFDFHAECRSMRYDRLTVLLNRVQQEQTEFGYFLSRSGSVLLRQTGVFRTNCVDCLDRTNVVQSLFARRQLIVVLKLLGVIQEDELDSNLEFTFKNVWADHADMISTQYSGTGALKTDFTRTGKRTTMGLIKDGVNSLTRYYKNNFTDAQRQDAIDLLLGKYIVQEGEGNTVRCPLHTERPWQYFAVPSVLLVAVSMFCASATLPSQYDSSVLLYLMFWGTCIGVTLNYIVRHGKEYVEWPHLDAGGLASTSRSGQQNSL